VGPPEVPPSDLQLLNRELLDDARREVEIALKVAVLVRLELPQPEIAARLGISVGDVKQAVNRLRRIADRIDRDHDAEHE
jgi:DNA-directed RNA polymerase specialized sigma24 family protein